MVMYPTMAATGADAGRGLDDEFWDLLLADEETVRARFEAIIATEWSPTPPNRPRTTGTDELRSRGRVRVGDHRRGHHALTRADRREVGKRSRQRSPPNRRHRHSLARRRKAGGTTA